MPFTLTEDGDTLQIRASISDAQELAQLIEKLETRRSGWRQHPIDELPSEPDYVNKAKTAAKADRDA